MSEPKLQPDAWAASAVKLCALSEIKPYERNARTHPEAQIQELAAAIEKWGWTQPIVIDEAGMILAGHARYEAAQLLDLDRVPVVEALGWSEEEKRAYVLADNRIALNAGWDEALLHVELDALRDADFDTSLLGWGCDLPGVDPYDQLDMSILDQLNESDEGEVDDVISFVKFITFGVDPSHHAELALSLKECRDAGFDFTSHLQAMLTECMKLVEADRNAK